MLYFYWMWHRELLSPPSLLGPTWSPLQFWSNPQRPNCPRACTVAFLTHEPRDQVWASLVSLSHVTYVIHQALCCLASSGIRGFFPRIIFIYSEQAQPQLSVLNSMEGRLTVPQDAYITIPRPVICLHPWQGGIKVANQQAFEEEDYPGSSRWGQSNPKGISCFECPRSL